ncbi:MAG: hypothetical protein QOI12_5239 [Alphaproteobacteria bacterium]|jgi:hypothetical protein|nr:hypothetical protein [Alphaproteobacteria bacterium]
MRRGKFTGPKKEGDGGSYEIGYCRPPTHSQFRPGQSGYPAGRRKGVRNLKTDVLRTLKSPVRVKEGGRWRTRSTQAAALLVVKEKALRGDTRALTRILELALRYNSDPVEFGPTQGLTADDQAILAAYEAEVAAAAMTPATAPSDADPALKPDAGSGKKPPK